MFQISFTTSIACGSKVLRPVFFSTIFARPGKNRREKEEKVPLCRRPKPGSADDRVTRVILKHP
jgi:hypothetical protein